MFTIKVVSNEGHTEIEAATAEEAVAVIQQEVENGRKWAYINSNAVDVNDLTAAMLNENAEITLTNPLVGG